MESVLRLVAGAIARALGTLGRRVRPGEYRGLGHPAGPLRLELKRDGRFRLQLAIWDPVVRDIVGYRELIGHWRRSRHGLELETPTRRLDYRATPEVLEWERSTLPTFADGIDLRRTGRSAGRRTPVATDDP